MDKAKLKETAQKLVSRNKGILAADESTGTITKRLSAVGVKSTEENRRVYRELLFTTQGVEEFISGVIMFDETIRQSSKDGVLFPKLLSDRGIIPGIKVDKGKTDLANFPGEKITEGLDGLRGRLKEYFELGARFAKWRAVITIGKGIPTQTCIDSNAEALARYAALCQEVDMVPIVEPEVLMDGDHDIERSEDITRATQTSVFRSLDAHGVFFGGMLLKPNMVHSGKNHPGKPSDKEVAEATLRTLKRTVPPEVPGIVFLSGGDAAADITSHLDVMNEEGGVPWQLSFSFGRALQKSALEAWHGREKNIKKAQEIFYNRAKLDSLARSGEYDPSMEKPQNEDA